MASIPETMTALQSAHPESTFQIRKGSTWTSATNPGITYEVSWTGETTTPAVLATLDAQGWPSG